jgi:hypothetical protein
MYFYECDGKNWDSTMSQEIQAIKLAYYRGLGMEEHIVARIEEQLRTRGYFKQDDSYFTYTANGTVKSGHNDTTIGNSVINGMVLVDALLENELSGVVIVCGDDSLVAGGRVLLQKQHALDEHIRNFGIRPESKMHQSWVTASFISGYWYPTLDGFTFGPKIGRTLARLYWTVRPPGKKKEALMLKAIAYGLKSVWGVPILGDFITLMSRGTTEDPTAFAERLMKDEAQLVDFLVERKTLINHLGSGVAIIKSNVYSVLAERYDLSVEEIKDAANYVRSLPTRPVIVSHPILDIIVAKDTA